MMSYSVGLGCGGRKALNLGASPFSVGLFACMQQNECHCFHVYICAYRERMHACPYVFAIIRVYIMLFLYCFIAALIYVYCILYTVIYACCYKCKKCMHAHARMCIYADVN